MIDAHGLARRMIREQIKLLFLDPVLHFAPPAILIFIKRGGIKIIRRQRGHNETGIGLVARLMLGLADHPALAAPAFFRAIGDVAEGVTRHPARVAVEFGRVGLIGVRKTGPFRHRWSATTCPKQEAPNEFLQSRCG